MKLPKNFRFKKGITLLELVTVIAVAGAIAVIGLTLMNPAKHRGQTRDAQRKKDIADMAEALGFYLAAKGNHPPTNMCDSSIGASSTLDCWAPSFSAGSNWTSGTATSHIFNGLITDQQVLKNLPVDPKNNKEFHYRYKHSVQPNCSANCNSYYWIGTKLESPKDPNKWVFRCTDMDWLGFPAYSDPNHKAGCMEITPSTANCNLNIDKDCWQE